MAKRLPACARCGGPVLLEEQLDGAVEARCLLCSREPGDPHPRPLTDAELAREEAAVLGAPPTGTRRTPAAFAGIVRRTR